MLCNCSTHPKQKFEPRAIPCVFVGYPCGKKSYKLYDMQSKKKIISRDVKFCEDDFPFSSDSQTLTLAPSTPIFPFHDPSYSNIRPPPSIPSPPIPPSPSIPSPTTSSSLPPSLDSHTNSNPIPPDTSAPLRRSTRTKQPPAWHKDYEMSSGANHSTSSSSPGTGTRYPIHHYLSFSRFSPTQRAFLALITSQIKPKTYDEAVGDLLWQ